MCHAQVLNETNSYSRFEGKRLLRAIKIISNQSNQPFSYNPEAIEELIVPAMPPGDLSLEQFLIATLKETGFSFENIGGVIVIIPLSENEVNQQTSNRRDFAISGIVRDRISGEPLPFASIAIVNTSITTIANTDGKFTLIKVPSDTATITIRYIGYQGISVRLNTQLARSYLYIEMLPLERLLPSIQIIGNKEELVELQCEAGHITFNPAEISKLPILGEGDLFTALRWLPGISDGLQGGSGVKIRGSASDQNLVIFDGISVYHTDHFFGFFSAFNSSVVKNVQLYKGGFGAEYGGRTSGVLNITAIEGNNKDASILAELNTMSISTLIELPLVQDKATLVFAFRRGFTDIIKSTTFKNIFNNIYNTRLPGSAQTNVDVFESDNVPDFFYYDLNTKITFKPTVKDAISISFYNGADDLQMSFISTSDEISRESMDNTRWGNTGGSLKWSRKWNKRMFTYALFGLSSYRSTLEAEESFYFNQDILLSRRFFDQRTHLTDYTFRLDNTYEFDELTSIDFGYWYTNYRILLQSQDQDFIFQDSTQSASLHAMYASVKRKLGPVSLTAGLRISPYTGTNQTYVAPRLSFSTKILSTLNLKAAYGIYHQMIRRLNERSLYFSIPETWSLAGIGPIPLLQSHHYLAGATWDKNGWQVDIEGYIKTESGTIEIIFPELVLSSGNIEDFAVNGQRHIKGVDLLIKRNFNNQNILFSYAYTLAQSKYAGINNGEYFRSSGYALHELGAVYNINRKRWDFSTAISVSSGLPYTEVLGVSAGSVPDNISVNISGLNNTNTEWNHRIDLSLGYTIPLKKSVLQMGVSIHNLYNNQPIRAIDYFLIPDPNAGLPTLGRRDVPSLGFTPSAFLRVRI